LPRLTEAPECGVSLQGQEQGQMQLARPGVLLRALPEARFARKASTSVKALITFAWL
jgi:hypothetical protein